LPKSLTDKVLF